MKILVSGGKSGVVEYVMRERKNIDFNKIILLDGNPKITKKIIQNMNYKENYKRFILSFEGKPNDEKIKKAYEEWKKLYMDSVYKKDEYNILSVLHKDTNNYHIHITIPNLHLITNTRLESYFDKLDRPRINEIRNYINLKNGWKSQDLKKMENNKPIKTQEDIINIWKKEHNQKIKPIKKERQKTQALIKLVNNLVIDSIKNANVKNVDDIKNLINDFENYTFLKQGEDTIKNFAYITIQDIETKKKYRIKNDIYKKNYDFENGKLELNILDDKDIFQKITPRKYKLKTVEIEKVLPAKLITIEKMNEKNRARISTNTSKTSKEKINEYYYSKTKIINTTGQHRGNGLIEKIRDRINRDTRKQKQSNRALQQSATKIGDAVRQFKVGAGIMKTEIKKFKTEISLVDFAISCHYKINEKKSSKMNTVLENDTNKILISKNIDNNEYIYFDLETGKGGSIIDFYKNNIKKDIQFWKILSDLRKYNKNKNYVYNLKPTRRDLQKIIKENWNMQTLTEKNNYLLERGINEETQREFYNFIKIDNRNNLSFVNNHFLLDENNKLKIEVCGITRRNKDFAKMDGDKGLWGKKVGNKNDFYIFESEIDAMSFFQLHKKEGNYISTGGNLSKKQIEDFQNLFKHQKPNKINICVDNDEGGDKISDRISDMFFPNCTIENCDIERLKPNVKDWNDDIKQPEEKIILNKKMKSLKDEIYKLNNKVINTDLIVKRLDATTKILKELEQEQQKQEKKEKKLNIQMRRR